MANLRRHRALQGAGGNHPLEGLEDGTVIVHNTRRIRLLFSSAYPLPTALCHDPLTPEFGLRCIRAGRLAMSPSGVCVIETLRKKARLPRDALGDL